MRNSVNFFRNPKELQIGTPVVNVIIEVRRAWSARAFLFVLNERRSFQGTSSSAAASIKENICRYPPIKFGWLWGCVGSVKGRGGGRHEPSTLVPTA